MYPRVHLYASAVKIRHIKVSSKVSVFSVQNSIFVSPSLHCSSTRKHQGNKPRELCTERKYVTLEDTSGGPCRNRKGALFSEAMRVSGGRWWWIVFRERTADGVEVSGTNCLKKSKKHPRPYCIVLSLRWGADDYSGHKHGRIKKPRAPGPGRGKGPPPPTHPQKKKKVKKKIFKYNCFFLHR